MIFKLKVSSFRNQYESPDGRRLCVFTAPVKNIPIEWEDWREVNVRDTNMREMFLMQLKILSEINQKR